MIEISVNNLVYLNDQYGGGRLVGRVDKTTIPNSKKPTTFYTGKSTGMDRCFDIPHTINSSVYIGGPADWQINPAFEAEIVSIVDHKQTT